ncbi:hypothetical protein [Foetidibacter luteolus]|uniref:hypothetical protein n=1 Tax=Foetidibacter luteolus TaxID=2608880 RepID=UPI00129ADA0E|nr:hypothetical protein [Foetidibacter luteolus]
MNPAQTVISREPDKLLIEKEFSFRTLTTCECDKSGHHYLKFEFINIDLPEVQILTSLFAEGGIVGVKSAVLKKRQIKISRLYIVHIRMDNDIVSWECRNEK